MIARSVIHGHRKIAGKFVKIISSSHSLTSKLPRDNLYTPKLTLQKEKFAAVIFRPICITQEKM
jgi:hypothetical protein